MMVREAPTIEISAGQQRLRVAAAGRDAHACGRCARPLGAAEVVWRVPIRVESEWLLQPQIWVAPVCEGCRPWWPDHRRPKPCSGCGRGVVSDADDYWPWPGHVFCSDRCAAGWWDHRRLMEMAGLEGAADAPACRACGRSLPGRRTTCSVACRQRLYRLRKREHLSEDALATAAVDLPPSVTVEVSVELTVEVPAPLAPTIQVPISAPSSGALPLPLTAA